MDYGQRIEYDADAFVRKIERQLEELQRFQFDSKYRKLFGDVFVQKLSDWSSHVKDRRKDPFTLVVCGEFKRGKSSLINAILGEDVVKTDVTTETVTLNRICYGVHKNTAFLEEDRRMQLSDDELAKDYLEEIIQKTDSKIRQIQIERPIEILKDIMIVDTPGLGDSFQDFGGQVAQALAQADAVIYVFSVNYPLSQQEQMLLRYQILPQRYTDLFLVGNFSDAMSSEGDFNRMKGRVTDRISNLLPGEAPWMLSALDERCRELGSGRPNETLAPLLEGNFAEFRKKLQNLIEAKKNLVLPDRMERVLNLMKADLKVMLDNMEKAIRLSEEEQMQTADEMREEQEAFADGQKIIEMKLRQFVEQCRNQANEWMDELLERMQQDLDGLTDVSADDLMKNYSFFCIDTIQEGMNRCLEEHTEKLYEKLDEISVDFSKKLSLMPQDSRYSFRFVLDNKTWTKGDNVSFVVNTVVSNSLISLVADGIAGSMRRKEIRDKTPDLLHSIRLQYTGMVLSVQETLKKTYSSMADRAVKLLNEYYSECAAEKKEQQEQFLMASQRSREEKRQLQEAIDEIRIVLDGK